MRNWRKSRAVAVVCIGFFLAVQLAIPISRFDGVADARRFGWQMFSSVQEAPEFVVITQVGEKEIDVSDHMAKVRADMDLVELLPPHLCSVVPRAVSVVWDDSEFRC